MNLFDDSMLGAGVNGVVPDHVWTRDFEPRIRSLAKMKARDRRFPDGAEFEAWCVEIQLIRNREGRGVRCLAGLPRAVENCSIDWQRFRRRAKNQTLSIDDVGVDPASDGDEIDTRLQVAIMEKDFAWLVVVGHALAAGLAKSTIADAFELPMEDFEAKLEGERELASLCFDGDTTDY